jgi:hypothetical protein
VAGVRVVEHSPEIGVWVRLRDLIERRIVLVDDLVDRASDSGVLDGPFELSRSLAADGATRSGGAVTRVGSSAGGGFGGREELGDAEIALG